MWEPFDEGRTIGETGSESGSIQFDDEHTEGARITLERDGHTPFAITCGIYGWMMHTRFLGNEDDAKEAYENMKQALDGIIRSIPLKSDPDRDSKMRVTMKMIEKFVEQYP